MTLPMPPKWFIAFMADICGRYPTWPCSESTVLGYWQTLQDIPAGGLAEALARHHATSRFAPAACDLREAVQASLGGSLDVLTAAEAWEEMRRNRKIGTTLKYEERPDAYARLADRIRWSSEAVRRAAEAVDWTNGDWMTEQIPTIRAQFERYYNAIKDKQERIDKHAMLDNLVGNLAAKMGGRSMGKLYGADYRDPLPDAEPKVERDFDDSDDMQVEPESP